MGAGRPRKSDTERWLGGDAGKRHQKRGRPAALPPPAAVEMPAGLTPEEVAVWQGEYQHALTERTLTAATVQDFAELCRLEVERAAVLTARRAEGWTQQGLQLAREYRGLVQRVEAKRRAFRLAPMGKPLVEETPRVEDPFAEFDGPVN